MNYRQLMRIRKNALSRNERKDKLTGIYNRDYFLKHLGSKLNGTMMKIKLDGINFININYGAKKGDELVTLIARKLDYACNLKGMTAARLSKFYFAIYTSNIDNIEINEFMEEIGNILIEEIEEMYRIHINFNIAGVIYKDKKINIEDAINKLDVCMTNLVKKGNKYGIYNEKYEEYISIKSIEDAIEKREIQIYYQPKVDLKSEKITGVEALIRWFSPEHGNISPEKIIDFAEECGYINILGKWILEKACKDIKYLNIIMDTDIDLSVNIAPNQLDNEYFIEELIKSVEEIGFRFDLLKLEITESENIEEIIKINDIINEIKSKGIKISLDDFGKGFNSINYIKNYNVDEIKIDKTLVEYVNKNPMFIESLIKMIHTTKSKVVAEGVETELEYLKLKRVGCDIIQGYYFYKPMNLYELVDVIGKEKYVSNKKIYMS
ncbi:MAG: EAL domain-containing protein [Paraclostridium sp.]|uniref:EAL domain-containing protein n=1 Tax=Paraclostridium sp. TaxID=2023273 RepID=UPI003F38145F